MWLFGQVNVTKCAACTKAIPLKVSVGNGLGPVEQADSTAVVMSTSQLQQTYLIAIFVPPIRAHLKNPKLFLNAITESIDPLF